MGCSGTKISLEKGVANPKTYKIVFVRHGESVWNKENRFTGWTDVDLSETGVQEAYDAGDRIKNNNLSFDICFVSMLQRAQKTWNNISERLGLQDIPKVETWKLNERHYGALQGITYIANYRT
jgi:2,3-bisphosphoglycerate-dependent phosphoglycerate mutase